MKTTTTLTGGWTYLVRQGTITPHQDIISHSLPKHLNLQRIRDNLLRLPINIRMYKRNIIITRNDISQSTQPLFNPLNSDLGR